MRTLYIFRHGRSVMNDTPEIIGGRSNHSPLTQLGEEQAFKLGLWIAARQLRPDAVFATPAVRTQETARIALESAGLDLQVVVDDRLQELGQGVYEGKPRKGVYERHRREVKHLQKDFKFEGGDSMNDVAERKLNFVTEVAGQGHETVFVFGHGFATRILAGSYMGWSHREIRDRGIDNCAATIFEYESGGKFTGLNYNINTQNLS